MLHPSKVDCITILRAASQLGDGVLLPLEHRQFGLTRYGMEAAAAFLIERACFIRHRREDDGHYAVGGLSLQGRLRLEQFLNG